MLTLRKEVQVFVGATETLLSPILLGKALNEDERDMVAMCAQNLAAKYPMSVAKPKPQSKIRLSTTTAA